MAFCTARTAFCMARTAFPPSPRLRWTAEALAEAAQACSTADLNVLHYVQLD